MSQRNDLDQMLSGWLDDPYTPPAPRYLADVLERTRATRQRPAWANPERWLPVAETTLGRTTPSVRLAWLLLIALVLAALVGVAVVGSGLSSKAPIAQGGGAVLAFGSIDETIVDGSRNDIFTVRADGTDLRRLTDGLDTETVPAFSPDGRRIAFRRWQAGTASTSIVVTDAGGGNAVTLASNSSSRSDCVRGGPTWSPDGSTIIFPVSAACDQRFDLLIVAADGSAPAQRLLADGTDSLHPVWSPDGAHIAFLGTDAGDGVRLYLVDASPGAALAGGLTPRRIGTTAGDLAHSGASIQWSPDGTELATVSQSGDVIVIKPDGSGSRVLARRGYDPRWSPDGRRLAFHRAVEPAEYFEERPCTARIWVIDADGTNERRLEDLGDGCDAAPSWSPDGTRLSASLIASTSTQPNRGFHLGIITIDGSSPTVILRDGPAVSWQPVAAPLPAAPSFPSGSTAP